MTCLADMRPFGSNRRVLHGSASSTHMTLVDKPVPIECMILAAAQHSFLVRAARVGKTTLRVREQVSRQRPAIRERALIDGAVFSVLETYCSCSVDSLASFPAELDHSIRIQRIQQTTFVNRCVHRTNSTRAGCIPLSRRRHLTDSSAGTSMLHLCVEHGSLTRNEPYMRQSSMMHAAFGAVFATAVSGSSGYAYEPSLSFIRALPEKQPSINSRNIETLFTVSRAGSGSWCRFVLLWFVVCNDTSTDTARTSSAHNCLSVVAFLASTKHF